MGGTSSIESDELTEYQKKILYICQIDRKILRCQKARDEYLDCLCDSKEEEFPRFLAYIKTLKPGQKQEVNCIEGKISHQSIRSVINYVFEKNEYELPYRTVCFHSNCEDCYENSPKFEVTGSLRDLFPDLPPGSECVQNYTVTAEKRDHRIYVF